MIFFPEVNLYLYINCTKLYGRISFAAIAVLAKHMKIRLNMLCVNLEYSKIFEICFPFRILQVKG
jgi:hypothetical protein